MAQMLQTSKAAIADEIRKFVSRNFTYTGDLTDLGDDDSFMANGIIDSTGVLELVYFIEDTFSIRVEDNELVPDNLDTVNKVAAYVHRKMRDAG